MAAGDAIVGHVVTFGRVLREAGLEVGPGRVADALRALATVDLARQEDVYFSLRQTLVSRHDELELFDRAYAAWFLRAPVLPPVRQRSAAELVTQVGETPIDRLRVADPDLEPGEPLELGASGHELLRDRDFAELSGDELRRVRTQVRPGMTGLWQVEAADSPSIYLYRRLDLYYVENWTVVDDLSILARTAWTVVARGALRLRRGDRS